MSKKIHHATIPLTKHVEAIIFLPNGDYQVTFRFFKEDMTPHVYHVFTIKADGTKLLGSDSEHLEIPEADLLASFRAAHAHAEALTERMIEAGKVSL